MLYILLFSLSTLSVVSGGPTNTDLFGGKDVRIPTTGPCVMNDDGMKCTKHGYYETVQCNENACFCVGAHNGQIAYDTTTDNNKTAPKCGACHVYLQKLFSNGDPAENTFIPKCDVSYGDFESVQCNSKVDTCFCVDEKTGKEKIGTRKPRRGNEKLNCNKIEFSIDSSEFPKFEKNNTRGNDFFFPVGREWCKLDRDRGSRCSAGKPGLRYFFDRKTSTCLAFEYLGCEGNNNKYHTKGECFTDCVLADFFSCSGLLPPARQSNGQSIICGNTPQLAPGVTSPPGPPGPSMNKDGCPKGYQCTMGPFFGFCCHSQTEERYRKAWSPVCKNGKKAKFSRDNGYDEFLFGISCSDNFCPSDHTCESNDIFAFCCPR